MVVLCRSDIPPQTSSQFRIPIEVRCEVGLPESYTGSAALASAAFLPSAEGSGELLIFSSVPSHCFLPQSQPRAWVQLAPRGFSWLTLG